MLGYFSLVVTCCLKLTVFLDLCYLKTVLSLEKVMSADKHLTIFLCQVEAIAYIYHLKVLHN